MAYGYEREQDRVVLIEIYFRGETSIEGLTETPG